jgi:hypothetical protein
MIFGALAVRLSSILCRIPSAFTKRSVLTFLVYGNGYLPNYAVGLTVDGRIDGGGEIASRFVDFTGPWVFY